MAESETLKKNNVLIDIGPVKTLTLDLETSGLDWLRDEIYLIGYRINSQGPVIQIVPGGGDDETFRLLLADPKVTKRGHNVRFDLHFLRCNGYEVSGPFDDTSILCYLEDPFRSTSLKDLVEQKLQQKVTRMEDFAIRPKKKELDKYVKNSQYWKIDKDFYEKQTMAEYNQADVINCDELRKNTIVTDWYKNVENPLVRFIYNMESRGIQLNLEHLRGLKKEYEQTLQDIEKGIGGINPRSPKQLGDYLKAKGADLKEKTKKGKDKTDKLVLKRLLWSGFEAVRPILKHRELSKLLSTYVNSLLDKSDKHGRIHGSFNQAGRESEDNESTSGTRTGRLSSSEPNLQNIPTRTKEGKRIRQAFIPTSGFIMFESDLSQIEPRYVAHYSQSAKLISAYKNKVDTHRLFASDIFEKPMDQITELERFIGKTSWLATTYGCWYKKLRVIAENQSEDPVPYDEAYFEHIQNQFWRANPEIASWRRQLIEETKQLGYVETYGGRKIKIPNLYTKNKWDMNEVERTIVNYKVQGSAADAIKLILIRFNDQFEGNYGHVLGTVHDSILGEVPKQYANPDLQWLHDIVNEIMTTTVKLNNVPIEAETKFGNNWAECK